MEGRDENKYFHSKASDEREPYKSWLAKNAPGRSFAEVPYVYADNPETRASLICRRFLFAAIVCRSVWMSPRARHDKKPDTDRVPYGFHAVPDTDYEFSFYGCEGEEKASSGGTWRRVFPASTTGRGSRAARRPRAW